MTQLNGCLFFYFDVICFECEPVDVLELVEFYIFRHRKECEGVQGKITRNISSVYE